MAYQRTTWSSGDIISTAKLNNIEAGIASLEAAQEEVFSNLDAVSGEDAGYDAIPFTGAGSFVRTGQTGEVIKTDGSLDIVTNDNTLNCKYAVIPVEQGDRFTVFGSGQSGNRLWAWIGSDGRVTRQRVLAANNPQAGVDFAAPNTTVTDGLELVAPAEAKWLIINTTDDQKSFYGFKPAHRMDSNEKTEYRHNRAIKRATDRNPFAFKPFDEAMVSFVFDDLRSDLDLTASIFAEYGVPLCVAAIPENLDNKASGLASASQGYDPNMTMLEIMNKIVEYGGEIMTHGSTPITDNNQTDNDFMRKYFVTSKETLENAGYKVRGLIRVGNSGTLVASKPSERIEEWLVGSYDYSNMGDNVDPAVENPYYMADNYAVNRVLFSNTSVAAIKAQIDAAKESPRWLIYGGHQVSGEGSAADFPAASLREILDYCVNNNVRVVTWAYVFDHYASSVQANKTPAITVEGTTLMIECQED